MTTQPPTEGPWFVHQIPGIEKAGKMYPISAHSDPMTTLAYVGAVGHPNLPNAHLIAAAPDLYAALRRLLPDAGHTDRCTNWRKTGSGRCMKSCAAARAALARAEGHAHG